MESPSTESTKFSPLPNTTPIQLPMSPLSDNTRRPSGSFTSTDSDHGSRTSAESSPAQSPAELPSLPHPLGRATTLDSFTFVRRSASPHARASPSPSAQSPPRPRRRSSCFSATRFAILLWVTTISIAIVCFFGDQPTRSDPIQLETVAHINTQHALLALQVVRDLKNVGQACRRENLHFNDLSSLSSATRPFNGHVADGLLVSSDTAETLAYSLFSPDSYVSGKLSAVPFHIAGINKELRRSQLQGLTPELKSRIEKALRGHHSYFHQFLSLSLQDTLHLVDVMREQCEVILHQGATAIPELQNLQSQLGLLPPPRWMFWKQKSWEHSGFVRERRRWLSGLLETQKNVERLMHALEKSQTSLSTYLKADVFEAIENLPPIAAISNKNLTVVQYLEFIAAPLEELERLIREAKARTFA